MIIENFTESLRYLDYEISPDDTVIDCGGYEGTFAAEINRIYHCHVVIFEPIKEFYDGIVRRFEGNPKIRINNAAVGAEPGLSVKRFKIKGCMTGEYADGPEVEVASINLREYCELINEVSLLKLNIESGEFPVLEDLIEHGAETKFKNIQVQFHNVVPDAEARYKRIRKRLLATHELTFDFPWCWENYRLKGTR